MQHAITTYTTLTHGGFLISKYTVVWGPRHGVVSCSESFDGFIAHMHFSPYNAYQIFLSVDALLCSHALG